MDRARIKSPTNPLEVENRLSQKYCNQKERLKYLKHFNTTDLV